MLSSRSSLLIFSHRTPCRVNERALCDPFFSEMADYEIQVVPIDPYSYEGEGCVCVVVEHDTGKPVPCPNLNDVAEEGWMALRGPDGKLLGVICPKHIPVFRAQIEEEGGKLPIRLEG
jgi:hypothetical protein